MAELGDNWHRIETVGDTDIALPDRVERLILGQEAGAGQLVLSDEFGDAFGILDGSDGLLGLAIARALDQLYGVEWGTAEPPDIDPTSGRATFHAFGTPYVTLWQRRESMPLLFAVATFERELRARAFVDGVTVVR